MPRHIGVARFRGLTAENATTAQIEGRKLLGALIERLRLGGVKVGKVERTLDDGTRIVATFDGTLPIVTVFDPVRQVPAVDERADTELWIPRGFVVYPANAAAPQGWGLPVVQLTGEGITPYSTVNRAPGLDVARWTAGGALGQVLLTRDAGAGFPDDESIVVPLLFHAQFGIRPLTELQPPAVGEWRGFRIEFADFSAQSRDIGADEAAAIVAAKRAVFEGVNEHRISVGRDPLQLPIRGLHDSGQTTAEILHATHTIGHYSDRFPVTYRTYPDRLSKDGFRAFVAAAAATSRNEPGAAAENLLASGTETVIGVDPNGIPISDVVPGADLTGPAAVDAWLDSPIHRPIIEDEGWDGHWATTSIGFRHAFAAQHFYHNNQWIETGSRCWNSRHAEIPTLSWFGFATLNLAWETWPCAFEEGSGSTPPADPLRILTPLDLGGGQFWLRYYHAKEAHPTSPPYASNTWVPALDSRIFMRGRSVGVVPRGGWVWAAAVQKFESPDGDRFNVYRFVVLAHHEDDQPTDKKTHGMTRYLRVWWCDVTWDGFLAANAQSTIRGVYGQEDEGWPWDEVDSPYSWHDGGLVDVGSSTGAAPDLLKYASQWVFSSDGMRAICLRDYSTYLQYQNLYTDPATALFAVPAGRRPTAIELTFGGNAFNPLTVSHAWLGQNAGSVVQDYPPVAGWTIQTFPRAAGYDADDVATYAMDTLVSNPFPFHVGDNTVYRASYRFTSDYDYAPVSPDDGVLYTSAFAEDRYGRVPNCEALQVLDVLDEVTIAAGVIQRFEVVAGAYAANPDFTPCWLHATQPVTKVTVRRRGTVLSERAYDNPDGILVSWFALCWQTSAGNYYAGTRLPLMAQGWMLPSFARARDGEWIVSYTITPQPSGCYRATSTSSDCAVPGYPAWSCTPTLAADFVQLPENVATCRGGWMSASFADEAQLASLAGIAGAAPRFLYARAV